MRKLKRLRYNMLKNRQGEQSLDDVLVTSFCGLTRENSQEDEILVVSDYAVMQGAEYDEDIIGNASCIGGQYTRYSSLKPTNKYQDEVFGIRPLIKHGYSHNFNIRHGFLTYKDEYVYFPQNRVNKRLSKKLTELATDKTMSSSKDVFGKFDCEPKFEEGYVNELYYLNGNQYCLTTNFNNSKDTYQWFSYDLVNAMLVDDDILCRDVMLADHEFNSEKFTAEIKNSVLRQKMILSLQPHNPEQGDNANPSLNPKEQI